MQQIDFVVTWVDGNDPQWRAQRDRYMPAEKNTGNSENRFRNWDLMRYWFRGVEKFAPWVHKVYFITCGHVPPWLNLEHPKLVHIKHQDYIPSECLPTFNSIVIENYLHRIPELSEHFVLFNDDFFLTDQVAPTDFFVNGLPCETAILGQLAATSPDDVFPYTIMNNMSIINKHFSKKEVMRRHFHKFFSLKYGKGLLRNIVLYPADYFSCFQDTHVASSYRKNTFEKVWQAETAYMKKGSRAPFRSKEDVTHWVFKNWNLCEGTFVPRKCTWSRNFVIGKDPGIAETIRRQKYKMICINDDGPDVDFEVEQRLLKAAFEAILPEQSGFEI